MNLPTEREILNRGIQFYSFAFWAILATGLTFLVMEVTTHNNITFCLTLFGGIAIRFQIINLRKKIQNLP